MSTERGARARLSQLAEPGDERLGAEVARLGATSVLARIEAADASLRGVEHYRARLALDADEPLIRVGELGGRFVIPGDGEWPTQLAGLGDRAPFGLYVVGGDLRLAAVRSVAVVGARAATEYGQHVASELATDLALAGWTVTSGAAYGIDAAGHRGAITGGGMTIAVLAFGCDVVYPKGHDALLARVRESGVLMSEHPPGTTPTKRRFLERNRLIAGLSRGTVVVEAALRSGALSTAAWARRLGRPVMAVPGPVTSAQSAGCHRLVQHDEPARLVTDASEVIEEVGMIGELADRTDPLPRVHDLLAPRCARVLEAMPAEHVVDPLALAVAAGLDPRAVQAELVDLQTRGLVREASGGYARVPGAAEVRPQP